MKFVFSHKNHISQKQKHAQATQTLTKFQEYSHKKPKNEPPKPSIHKAPTSPKTSLKTKPTLTQCEYTKYPNKSTHKNLKNTSPKTQKPVKKIKTKMNIYPPQNTPKLFSEKTTKNKANRNPSKK